MTRIEHGSASGYDSYVVQQSARVSERSVRAYQGGDLLTEQEAEVLGVLVCKVHEYGRAGVTWPVVERHRSDLFGRELEPDEPMPPDGRWLIRARVLTVPK